MWTTKKALRRELEAVNAELNEVKDFKDELARVNSNLATKLTDFTMKYPFDMGDVVYDLQLRSNKGRFTKSKASREHSIINEVVVDKRNYFNLVERLNNKDVFKTLEAAESHLAEVCVD